MLERLRQIVAGEKGGQSAAALKLKVSQQTISKALAPGVPNVGMLLARSIASHLGMTFDELVGPGSSDAAPLSPRDQVRATPLYRGASEAVRRRFDDLALYTRTGETRDALWFTRRLAYAAADSSSQTAARLAPSTSRTPRRPGRLVSPSRAAARPDDTTSRGAGNSARV